MDVKGTGDQCTADWTHSLSRIGSANLVDGEKTMRVGLAFFATLGCTILTGSCDANTERTSAAPPNQDAHQVEYVVTDATLSDAHSNMCRQVVSAPCDSLENYRVEISINRGNVGLVFFHVELGPRRPDEIQFVPAFTCRYYGPDLTCIAEQE